MCSVFQFQQPAYAAALTAEQMISLPLSDAAADMV